MARSRSCTGRSSVLFGWNQFPVTLASRNQTVGNARGAIYAEKPDEDMECSGASVSLPGSSFPIMARSSYGPSRA
eukprot:scaffold110341_cov40-Phaeocystis_antarctica.AAC.1